MNKRILMASLAAFAVGAAGLSMFSHAQDEAAQPAQQGETIAIDPSMFAGEADPQAISYALGFRIGSDFAERQVQLDADEFAKGFAAALAGEESRLSEQELMQALLAFQMQMQAQQQQQAQRAAEESQAFLEQNRQAEGVQVTDSGLQYRIIREGQGESPKATDTVTVHYRGTLVDGTQFDSSYDRGEPAQFPTNRVIPGWTEALQMMKPGAKWELFIPAELAYGEQGTPGGPIPPHAALKFEVELLGIND